MTVIKYTDLLELFLVLFVLLSFIFFIISYYFHIKIKNKIDLIENNSEKKYQEVFINIKNLDKKIDKINTENIENNIESLLDIEQDILKILSIKSNFSKNLYENLSLKYDQVTNCEIKNRKLLNIILRKLK